MLEQITQDLHKIASHNPYYKNWVSYINMIACQVCDCVDGVSYARLGRIRELIQQMEKDFTADELEWFGQTVQNYCGILDHAPLDTMALWSNQLNNFIARRV